MQAAGGDHTRQLAIVAGAFEHGQRLQCLVDVALDEGDPREHHVGQDHVIGQADMARQRGIDVEQLGGGFQIVGLVDGEGMQHAGPGVAVGADGRERRTRPGDARGQAKTRRGLALTAFLQVDDALDGFREHGVEGALVHALHIAGAVQQRPRALVFAHHRVGVGERVHQCGFGEGFAGGQGVERLAADGIDLLEVVHDRQNRRPQGQRVGPDTRVRGLFEAGLFEFFHRRMRAAAEAQRPDMNRLQQRPGGKVGRRNAVEPAPEQAHAPLREQMLGVLRHECKRTVEIATFQRVVDRRHRPVLRLEPGRGRAMQGRDLVRAFLGQAMAQKVREQAVVAVKPLLALDWHEEHVGLIEQIDQRRAVGIGQ